MKMVMIDAFKGASGKICEHSDMGVTYNQRTGQTYSRRCCYVRNTPPTEAELKQRSAFAKRSAAVNEVLNALTTEQRQTLLSLRNARKLYSIRQLIDEIYDKETQTVPAAALAALLGSTDTGSNGGGDLG